MNFENTQNRFRLLSGLSETECEQWNSVMSEAAEYVKSIVVKKKLTESDMDRLGNLAGVLAYCKYMIYSIESGSGVPNKTKVAKITKEQLTKIAEQKMPDLNAGSLDAAISMIAGTARSMGITVVD